MRAPWDNGLGTAFPSKRWPSWQRFTWRHLEWWTLILSAIAWLVLVSEFISGLTSPDWSHAHHHGGGMPAELAGSPPAWSQSLLHWSLMVIAMMPPLVVGSVRATARRSLWRRRDRAIGGFLVGYLTPWLVVGCIAAAATTALGLGDARYVSALAAVGFAIAAVWQVTPAKQRALWSCHRTAPLAPDGWRADRDCVRYGWEIGRHCLASCWAMMLACLLAGHSLPAMIFVGISGASERYTTRSIRSVISSLLAGLALVYAILALFEGGRQA